MSLRACYESSAAVRANSTIRNIVALLGADSIPQAMIDG